MAIKTEMLRYFVAVAEAGNLSEAAKVLGRTPSAVSMMLKHFEEIVGAPLFETDRKNRLTPLGVFTLEESRRELLHFEQVVNSINRFAMSGEGQVRIACLPGPSAVIMPGIIKMMHAQNPHLVIRIRDMLTEGALSQIRAENVDVAIVNTFSAPEFSNIKSVPILQDRYGIVCRRDSTIGRKESPHWSDIAQERLISNGLSVRLTNPHIRKATIKSFLTVESALTARFFVSAGEGIAIFPEVATKNLPADLVFRIPEDEEIWRTAYLVWNENHYQSPAVLRFSNLLRETVRTMGMTPNFEAKESELEWPGASG